MGVRALTANYRNIFSSLKKQIFPIGVDMGTDTLKVAQLGADEKGIFIISAACEKAPEPIEVGSSQWQRWTVGTLKQLISDGIFHGRDVVTALSSDEVFMEQLKVPKRAGQKLDEVILASIRGKLSFSADEALVKYVITGESTDGDLGQGSQLSNEARGSSAKQFTWEAGKTGSHLDVLVMVTERVKVNRHLAIYENANLEVKQIGVWPLALANSYVKFFGRRQSDKEKIVMLIQTGANFTNVAICRGSDVLFARLIPMGLKKLGSSEMVNRLILELSACEHYFESLSGMNRIERLVYFSGQNSDKTICDSLAQLAQHRHIPAQLADVLGAVKVRPGISSSFDRRNCKVNWATAFGLSLF